MEPPHHDRAPEVVAQFIFVFLIAGLMFGMGLIFRPRSPRARLEQALRDTDGGAK